MIDYQPDANTLRRREITECEWQMRRVISELDLAINRLESIEARLNSIEEKRQWAAIQSGNRTKKSALETMAEIESMF